jgi:Fe-S-cluster containining protein
MICLRCGYCCINLSVIIIHPDYIQKELKFENLPEKAFMLKFDGELCPHLAFEDKKAICKIHHFDWFKDTPCHQHTQIEQSKDCNCRMGEYLLKENISVFKFVRESGEF